MRLVKIINSGEIRRVANNDAHALIERGVAVLVALDNAEVHEPQSTELRQESRKVNLRQRGSYIVK